MYWYWIHVYNQEEPLGSFYTQTSKRDEVIKEINDRYKSWTRFTSE